MKKILLALSGLSVFSSTVPTTVSCFSEKKIVVLEYIAYVAQQKEGKNFVMKDEYIIASFKKSNLDHYSLKETYLNTSTSIYFYFKDGTKLNWDGEGTTKPWYGSIEEYTLYFTSLFGFPPTPIIKE
ncbi:hypothetical protein MENTO_v1c04700 [Mesoplasma entomophilum]|uniref:Uncharacterized protein n=1 Tax=Mesoplasma entomophilum TaxID=2149 RepID=A0A3S5XZY1_9MOLU|nr:hypothetical protein [Mesoplasma entomophilum]ATQ35606.1 hypothetical protein CS528_02435 [Mesoplasma entomophilum]ATZ19575.1 hypothetical protein MENTO_v1c04700 [Mesoplasma entomophilum]